MLAEMYIYSKRASSYWSGGGIIESRAKRCKTQQNA